jgi:acetyl esterase/lipase
MQYFKAKNLEAKMNKSSDKLLKVSLVILICLCLITLGVCQLSQRTVSTMPQENIKTTKQPESTLQVNEPVQVLNTSNPIRYINNLFNKVDIEKNILYQEVTNYSGQKEKLYLDVFKPKGDTESNRPAILWIHGGSFTTGTKDFGIERDLATEFAKKGYVTVNINYRLRKTSSNAAIKDAIEDASSALGWLALNSEKYGVDAKRIIVAGYSAGAITAINLYNSIRTSSSGQKNNIFSVIDLAGGSFLYGSITKEYPPCVIINGTNDTVQPYSAAKNFAKQLDQKGVSYTLHPLAGSGHDMSGDFDEVTDVITQFLYKELTGKDFDMKIRKGSLLEKEKLISREKSGKVYRAKQINIKVDGKLDEWGNSDIITLDQIKDVGINLPDQNDFSGTAMAGWNAKDPTRIYLAASITDDKLQDIHSAVNHWWEDDCLEFMLDVSKDQQIQPLQQWGLGANGKDLSGQSSKNNTEFKVIKNGNKYTYEAALDISKANTSDPHFLKDFAVKAGEILGLSIQYDDCENGVREHQIGIIAGNAFNRSCFVNLIFDATATK